MDEVKSVCRYCSGACGVVAKRDDEGRITALRGDSQNLLTDGFVCIRGLQAPAAMYSPERLLKPQKRLPDGSFVEIGLEQALDEIADRLRLILERHGPEAIATFGGTQTWKNVSAYHMVNAFFPAIGSTRFFSTITVDQSAKQITMRRMGYWDAGKHRLPESDVLMLLGGNPMVSVACINLCYDPVKRLKTALKRGMKLIVVDPRKTETAQLAQCFVQMKPGEDPSFLAGVLRVILQNNWHDAAFCADYVQGLEDLRQAVAPFTPDYVAARAEIAPEQVEEVARIFAHDSKSGVAALGTGPSMSPHSNLSDHLVECLNVICGRFYRAGERIINPGVQNKRRPYRAEVVPPFREWETSPKTSSGHGTIYGELMSCVLADEILREDEGRIRALLVNGGNPAVALPDQVKVVKAMRSLELLVAVEPFMTATAWLCDYVLPPKLQYERDDTAVTPRYESLVDMPFAQYVPAICAPPPGSDIADDWYFFWSIAKRLGKQIKIAGVEIDMNTAPTTETLLEIALREAQVPFAEIKAATGGKIFDVPPAFVEPRRPEATARFDIMPEDIREELAEIHAEHPALAAGYTHLLSVRRLRATMNSLGLRLPEVRKRHPYNAAHLHPDDLAKYGLEDEAEIEIHADIGHIIAIVSADETVQPGVLSISHCWGWLPDKDRPYTDMGASTNRLVRSDKFMEKINAMVRMSSIPVRICRRQPETAAL